MGTRPSGTVTFLFSDVEGSTRLWEHHPERMASALHLHDSAVRSAIRAHDGYVFSTAGDAFAAAFERAGQAVGAAVDAQRALDAVDWGVTEIRVRMGLHTGEADERDGDYFGPTLNRGARLMAAAHGGQVLASAVTARLAADRLPEGVTLVDVGEHRLKDLAMPEHVFQVTDATLPRVFPPLRTLDGFPNNLPSQLTRFVGRQREIEELAAVVPGSRLVTVTGVGGVGKTRLALQVAAEVVDSHPDGVWCVDLSALTDPALIPKQVAAAMGVQEQADRPVVSTLLDQLHGSGALVVLDNCEHLVEDVAAFTDGLLRSAPAVTVLATSREPLGIPGEHVWTLAPMALPEPGRERLAANEAVDLFLDRARLVDRAFTLTVDNQADVAEICRRLDGVPLAIELAAARVGTLSPRQIADRLGDRLAFLGKGPRTGATRQQSLRAAIDWSYDLLSPDEQAMLRRLAVFRGGFTLDAVQAVWPPPDATGVAALDLLEQLVDKSLVTVTTRGPERRFVLLETIRAYAHECLARAGELDAALSLHRAFFLEWAHGQSRRVSTSEQLDALAALEADHDNLRAALERSVAAGQVEDALLLAADLSFFWFVHSHFGESGTWYDRLLGERGRVATRARVKLLLGAGEFSRETGDQAGAAARLGEARRLARQEGWVRLEGWALYNLNSNAAMALEFDEARALAAEALARFEEAGDLQGVGFVTFTRAGVELLERLRTGSVGTEDGEELVARLRPMLDLVRGTGERNALGHALEVLGTATVVAHRHDEAASFLAEAVDSFDALGHQCCLAHSLERVAWFADETARPVDALRLLAAAEALRRTIGSTITLGYRTFRDTVRASAEARLSKASVDAAWQEGSAMDRQGAVALVREIARRP